MDAAELRQMQAPIKERYKTDPKAAYITLKAKGTLDDSNIVEVRDYFDAHFLVASKNASDLPNAMEPFRVS